jgi:hypothetical protein
MGGDDGPCKYLTELMQKSKGERPKDWSNYHDIDYKEPPISVDFMSDEEDVGGEGDENDDDDGSDD